MTARQFNQAFDDFAQERAMNRLAYVAVIKAEERRAQTRARFEAAHDELRRLWRLPPLERGRK